MKTILVCVVLLALFALAAVFGVVSIGGAQ